MRHNNYMSALAAQTANWCDSVRPGGIITMSGGEGRPRRPLIVVASRLHTNKGPGRIIGPDGTDIHNDDKGGSGSTNIVEIGTELVGELIIVEDPNLRKIRELGDAGFGH